MSLMNKVRNFINNNYFTFLVVGVVIFAFVLRYLHTKTGLPYLYSWDEPYTAGNALRIMKTGDFNPHFFNYGSMMIYSNLLVDILHYLSLMGHPSSAESYLTNMNEIIIDNKFRIDSGWHWTISHPSFYHWNRVLTALLGAGTIFVTYLIGKNIFNKWIGLIAAVFLAILPFHIVQSAWITTDVPVAFFALLVVLFSVLFIKSRKLSYFILSLVFVGVSIATKYNAALTLLVPMIALIIVYFQSRESVKTYMWFLIPTIPVVIFFMIMPYAILDLPTFLHDVGYEVRHYKILGHDAANATSTPGWEHFGFQMHKFYENLGLTNTIIIFTGLLGLLFRPLFIFTLLLPVVYILYMSGMKVNFHRNFVQIYPFLALLFASGVYYIYIAVNSIQKKFYPRKAGLLMYLASIAVFVLLLPQTISSTIEAKSHYKKRDTRTIAINEINKMGGIIQKVVFAKELKVHNQDLRRLKISYAILPLLSIGAATPNKNTLYVLPKKITSAHNTLKYKKNIDSMQKVITAIDKSSIVKTVGGNQEMLLDVYTRNPGIIFVKTPSSEIAWKGAELPYQTDVGINVGDDKVAIKGKRGFLTYGPYVRLPNGSYRFEIKYISKESNGTIVGYWDVVSSTSMDIAQYPKGPIYGTKGKLNKIVREFTILSDSLDERIEIRNYYNGVGDLTIKSLTITKIK